MSFIGSMMDPSNGSGFKAANTNILNLTDPGQLNSANNQALSGVQAQKDFLNAVNQANGVQNQQSVFNQLQGVANGTGPNPAMAQLSQQTGQNVSNQAALMAGQRGTNANPALLARQAAQQGASTQQNAVGQGASMQANQSLNALGQMGGLASTQAGQQQAAASGLAQTGLGYQSNIIGAGSAQNQANVGMQSNMNTVNGGIAQENTKGAGALTSGLMSGIGGAVGLAEGGEVKNPRVMAADGYPSLGVNTTLASPAPISGAQSAAGKFLRSAEAFGDQAPEGAKAPSMYTAGQTLGRGLNKGIKSSMNALFGGSSSPNSSPDANMGDTGMTNNQFQNAAQAGLDSSSIGGSANYDASEGTTSQAPDSSNAAFRQSDTEVAAEGGPVGMMEKLGPLALLAAARGGKVPALVSPGERYLPPKEVEKVVEGKKSPIKAGEKIPGKPKVGGAKNSYANDTVKKNLEEGGIVLPRSVTQAKDPAAAAHAFVTSILAKQSLTRGK